MGSSSLNFELITYLVLSPVFSFFILRNLYQYSVRREALELRQAISAKFQIGDRVVMTDAFLAGQYGTLKEIDFHNEMFFVGLENGEDFWVPENEFSAIKSKQQKDRHQNETP